jgi:hypothetical protein
MCTRSPDRERCHSWRSTSVEIRSCRERLFARRAGVHVDFHANRHFDDFWSFPSHSVLLLEQDGRLPYRNKDRITPKIAQAGIMHAQHVNTGFQRE